MEGAGTGDELTLLDGDNLCEEYEMVAYSLLKCVTSAKEISTTTSLTVKDVISDEVFSCANAASPAMCEYSTTSAGSAPTMTAVALDTSTQTTLTISGTNLDKYGTGSICEVFVHDIKADSCSISSGSEMTAVFTSGYPLSEAAVIPVVRILEDCDSEMEALCLVSGV